MKKQPMEIMNDKIIAYQQKLEVEATELIHDLYFADNALDSSRTKVTFKDLLPDVDLNTVKRPQGKEIFKKMPGVGFVPETSDFEKAQLKAFKANFLAKVLEYAQYQKSLEKPLELAYIQQLPGYKKAIKGVWSKTESLIKELVETDKKEYSNKEKPTYKMG